LAKNKKIQLQGPIFIAKRNNNSFLKEIATSIKIVDLFTGITRKIWEEYLRHAKECSYYCLRDPQCKNPYIKIWRLFVRKCCIITVEYQSKPFWKWNGIIYYPINYRSKHERFLGPDISVLSSNLIEVIN